MSGPRDDEGDGVRGVQSKRIEGFCRGLRNDLRPFRGVSEWCLDSDLACYQRRHNDRRGLLGFLGKLVRPVTPGNTRRISHPLR